MKNLFGVLLVIILFGLLCLPVLAEKKAKPKKEKELKPTTIEYQSSDQFHIKADLYLPPKFSKKMRAPVVILLHSLSENRNVWKKYSIALATKGYAVFVPDLRGHGESILDKKNRRSFWRSFKKEQWILMPQDVISGIDYLKNNNPQANIDKIIIVGSSMGAAAGVITAEKEKDKVKAIALLSPFCNYKGMESRVPLVNYGEHPLLIIVSKTDRASYDASQELIKYAQGEHEIALVNNAGHGTVMLKFEPKLVPLLYKWLEKNLPPVAEPIPAADKKKKGNKSSKPSSHH